jgi:hypothetical protein
MSVWLKSILLFLPLVLLNCSPYAQKPLAEHKLPKTLKESSGLALSPDGKRVWIIQDQGNPDKLYELDREGKLISDYKLSHAQNQDWEDLAQDEAGNLYIGDFGNNDNKRKDLTIYKLTAPNGKKDKLKAQKITFEYPQQRKFPPKKEDLLFDAEAFFYRDGHFFIITKNRADPFTGKALIYKVPAQAGHHKAQLISSFITCMDQHSCRITGADISPSGKQVALLGSGTLWLFSDFNGDDFTQGQLKIQYLQAPTQTEAVVFIDENTVLIADEENHKTGRKLYTYSLE